jgi:hypothetical protein
LFTLVTSIRLSTTCNTAIDRTIILRDHKQRTKLRTDLVAHHFRIIFRESLRHGRLSGPDRQLTGPGTGRRTVSEYGRTGPKRRLTGPVNIYKFTCMYSRNIEQ